MRTQRIYIWIIVYKKEMYSQEMENDVLVTHFIRTIVIEVYTNSILRPRPFVALVLINKVQKINSNGCDDGAICCFCFDI